MYALVDCNNFFVSCERVFDSRLEGKPVIVLSNNDGCAIARSNEAKALGITMGANYFEIERLVKKNDVQVFSTNFVLYADMSLRVKGLLSGFCPDIEDYSIDYHKLNIIKSQDYTLLIFSIFQSLLLRSAFDKNILFSGLNVRCSL